jgi:GntR family transcriptional regulator
MFIRIEPSSSVPIYRQIIDQIRYQIAAGVLKEGDKVPSVRELASQVAVNQNTILKVYNELCRDNVLKIVRGDGTYVSSGKQNISMSDRKEMVAGPLREAAVLAIQLGVPIKEASELLQSEYDKINSQRAKTHTEGGREQNKEQSDV